MISDFKLSHSKLVTRRSSVTFSLPKSNSLSIMETCSVVPTFESVNEILRCDHSNETSSAVLLLGTIWYSIFFKTKFRIFLESFDC